MLSESVQNDVTHLRERIVEKYYPKTKVTRVTDQELGLLDVMRALPQTEREGISSDR